MEEAVHAEAQRPETKHEEAPREQAPKVEAPRYEAPKVDAKEILSTAGLQMVTTELPCFRVQGLLPGWGSVRSKLVK